jgi:hypothetical protein
MPVAAAMLVALNPATDASYLIREWPDSADSSASVPRVRGSGDSGKVVASPYPRHPPVILAGLIDH